jgi:hypothetical protein
MATLTPQDKNQLSSDLSFLLKEDGDYLLLENGSKIITKFGQIARLAKNVISMITLNKN